MGWSPAALVVLASSSVQEPGDRNHTVDAHRAAQHMNPYSFQPYFCKSVSTCQITTKKPCLRTHLGHLHSMEALFLQVWFLYLQPTHQDIMLTPSDLALCSSGLTKWHDSNSEMEGLLHFMGGDTVLTYLTFSFPFPNEPVLLRLLWWWSQLWGHRASCWPKPTRKETFLQRFFKGRGRNRCSGQEFFQEEIKGKF